MNHSTQQPLNSLHATSAMQHSGEESTDIQMKDTVETSQTSSEPSTTATIDTPSMTGNHSRTVNHDEGSDTSDSSTEEEEESDNGDESEQDDHDEIEDEEKSGGFGLPTIAYWMRRGGAEPETMSVLKPVGMVADGLLKDIIMYAEHRRNTYTWASLPAPTRSKTAHAIQAAASLETTVLTEEALYESLAKFGLAVPRRHFDSNAPEQ